MWHRNIKSPAQHGMVLAWAWQLFLHRAMHSVARDSCQPPYEGCAFGEVILIGVQPGFRVMCIQGEQRR